MLKSLTVAAAVAVMSSVSGAALAQDAAPLTFKVYNPGEKSMFPVTSSLIEGPSEVVLVDAQFQRNDAVNVVKMIKDSGKKLKAVFVSVPDPDYYFGLDVVKESFPDVKILATKQTIKKINETIEGKVAYWGPILKENAPKKTFVPEAIKTDGFKVDGTDVKIFGLAGHDPSHTTLWVPSEQTVLGGVLVYDNAHVWQADNATPEARASWQKSLDDILALNPKRVIPGHFVGDTNSQTVGSIAFTKAYVAAVEKNAAKAKNSEELVALMKAEFPGLAERGTSDLGLSAKVVMGEMKWPAE